MKFLCKLSLKRSRSARLKVFLFVTIAQFALGRPITAYAVSYPMQLETWSPTTYTVPADQLTDWGFRPNVTNDTNINSLSSLFEYRLKLNIISKESLPDGTYRFAGNAFSKLRFSHTGYSTLYLLDAYIEDNDTALVNYTIPSAGLKSGETIDFVIYWRDTDLDMFRHRSNQFTFVVRTYSKSSFTTDLYPSFSAVHVSDSNFTLRDEDLISDKPIAGQIEDVEGAVNDVNETIKGEHQEEIDKADQAGSDMGSSLTDVTNKLSAIEILKLPWTMLTDLYNAINIQYARGWTFPSFSIMGYELWPSYNFSMAQIDANFPVLAKSVRLASSFVLCFAFGSYIRNFFVRVFGSSESEDG